MNPHKIIDPLPVLENLRKSPKQDPKTFLHFDGGLALSADLCNGNGACRKKEGTMCPSFQVTNDEYDTTRARANAFRNALRGELPHDSLQDILDLCIGCKGCKSECPSAVDMAKMKIEALYQYQEKNGYSLRERLFASFDQINSITFPFRLFINKINSSSLGKMMFSWLGLSAPPPPFAKEKFSTLFKKIQQKEGPKIQLMLDSYTEFYSPEIGLSAVHLMNQLGYHVLLLPYQCCGRAALSKGFLKEAKKHAEAFLKGIDPNLPLIGLEPSCLYTLFDEYKDLIGFDPKNCMLFDTFLANHLPLPFTPKVSHVALHGHCHQKALYGMQDTLKVLRSFEQLEVIEIKSGCCGMAGSFGYEKEHEEFSKKIAELKLLPSIRALSEKTVIIADGFSCRSQIKRFSSKRPLHLAELFILKTIILGLYLLPSSPLI